MIKEFRLFPLDRCCNPWGDSLTRSLILLTANGYRLAGSDQQITNCPFCGESKHGRTFSPYALTT